MVVVSEEVGVGKPDPAPFEPRSSAWASAQEVVMVGNDAGRDVAGARDARDPRRLTSSATSGDDRRGKFVMDPSPTDARLG